ncbi:MAG: hypothetical protein ACLQBA_20485 [Candidatus Binataceae bacterium]
MVALDALVVGVVFALGRADVARRFPYYLDGFEQRLAQPPDFATGFKTAVTVLVGFPISLIASHFCQLAESFSRFTQ